MNEVLSPKKTSTSIVPAGLFAFVLVLAGCSEPTSDEELAKDSERNSLREPVVGVYDSRALALAYWTGEVDGEQRARRFKTPETAVVMHQQVFSYHEPVEALEYIADKLPAVMKQAAVDVIVSKWDREELARNGVVGSGWDIPDSADDGVDHGWDRAGLANGNPGRVVEITERLIELYDPGERFSAGQVNIKNQKPEALDVNWLEVEH